MRAARRVPRVTPRVSPRARRARPRGGFGAGAFAMAAPPTRSGGASLPRPEASADAASLRAYLAKDTHARVSRLSADDFTSWLERETLERLHRDRPAALRARADATRRFHRRTIFPLEAAVAAADAAFDASDDRARIAAAEKAVAQARAAIEGITAHLAREDAVSEPGTGFFMTERGGAGDATERKYETDETKAREAEKRAATVARLDAARASLPGLRSALEACLSASRLYREREAARAALRDGRARTGLDAAESEAGSAERGAGAESGALGAAFEEAGLRAVARLIREGRFEVPGMRDEPRSSGEDALFMLRNMSLGMGLGEIDGALVRVRDDEKGVAHTAFSPSRSVAYGRRRRRSGFPETDDAPPDCNPKPPNVEVLAVFECKRNPDDARRGFLRRRADLGWLGGESPPDASDETSARPAYDPKRYVNRNHPTGHFVRGYHPVRRMERVTPVTPGSDILRSDVTDADGDETEETANDGSAEASEPSESRFLVVTKASFRRFANGFANGGAGFYFPRLCLVTRPRTMCGLDTKVRAPLMQRSCARVASHVFETRGEVLSADAFASEIASLRESVSTDPSGAKRGALREAIAPLRRWLAEKNAESEARDDETTAFAFGDRLPGRLAALDDAASVFELYLDAAEGLDPSASGGVVLVDA